MKRKFPPHYTWDCRGSKVWCQTQILLQVQYGHWQRSGSHPCWGYRCGMQRGQDDQPLQQHAVLWYHHYLQHPGHTQLEETINVAIYWKRMSTTIWSIMKSCKHAKSIRNKDLSMGTFPLSPLFLSLGERDVYTLSELTLLKAKMAQS